MWNYIPSVEKVIKVPPSMMMQSWMGSDFTNDDIVKESSISRDYEAEFRDLFERRDNPEQISLRDVEQKGSIEDALGDYYDKKVSEVALTVLAERIDSVVAELERGRRALRVGRDDRGEASPVLASSVLVAVPEDRRAVRRPVRGRGALSCRGRGHHRARWP